MTNVMLEELLPARFAQTSVPSSAAPGCLVRIYPNEGLGKMASITGGRVLVGRDPLAQLSIEDDSVSRRHATIEHADGFDTVQEALERELSRVRRRKSQLSVLMMDLDK